MRDSTGIKLTEKVWHKLGTHYTKYGSPINGKYWRLEDSDVVSSECWICKESVKRPTGAYQKSDKKKNVGFNS